MPKYTSDPKESVLKFRLNDDLKKWVDSKAKAKGVSVSEFIRQILEKAKRDNG